MDRFSELKAFCSVVTCGSFSAAARQLGVATSSVARLVDGLEERLGSPLLNRSTRNVTATDSGRAYFQRATKILSDLDDADDLAAETGGEPKGLLRVAAPVTFTTRYIAPLLAELMRRYPQLELDMHLSDVVSNLVDESIDVAIRIGEAEEQPNLIARKLSNHVRHICASPEYLKINGMPENAADLISHNCLQFSYNAGSQIWRLQADGELEEITIRGNMHVNNSEVLRQVVVGGAGLALLPDWLIQEELASGALIKVLPNYCVNPGAMDIGIYAMYPVNRRGSSKVKAFVDMLAEASARLDEHAK